MINNNIILAMPFAIWHHDNIKIDVLSLWFVRSFVFRVAAVPPRNVKRNYNNNKQYIIIVVELEEEYLALKKEERRKQARIGVDWIHSKGAEQ